MAGVMKITRGWASSKHSQPEKIWVRHQPVNDEGKPSKWPFIVTERLHSLRELIALRDAVSAAISWAEAHEAFAVTSFESIPPAELEEIEARLHSGEPLE